MKKWDLAALRPPRGSARHTIRGHNTFTQVSDKLTSVSNTLPRVSIALAGVSGTRTDVSNTSSGASASARHVGLELQVWAQMRPL